MKRALTTLAALLALCLGVLGLGTASADPYWHPNTGQPEWRPCEHTTVELWGDYAYVHEFCPTSTPERELLYLA